MSINANGLMSKFGATSEDEINFRRLIYDFLEYKWIIAIFVVVGLLSATLYTFITPTQYEGSILIQIDDSKAKDQWGLGSDLDGLTGGGNNPAARQEALIRSSFILEPVVRQLGLDVVIQPHYSFLISRLWAPKNLNAQINLGVVTVPPAYYNQPLRLVAMEAGRYRLLGKDSKLILQGEVGKLAKDDDRGIAIEVTQLSVKPGTEYDITKQPSLEKADNLINKLRIDELQGSSGISQTGILQLSLIDTNPIRLANILNTVATVARDKDAQRKSVEITKTLDFLNQQLPLVKTSLDQAELALNKYRATSGKVDIKFETQQLLMQLSSIEKQIDAANLKKVILLQRFTPQYPLLAEISDEIKVLQNSKTLLEERVKALPASDQIEVGLMRDVKVKNALYLLLLNKIQEYQVMEAGTVSDIRILTSALPPDVPLSKKGLLVIGVSFILSLLLACTFIIARKAFHQYVDDPHWAERQLDLTNLAIIPYSKQQTLSIKKFKMGLASYVEILAKRDPHDMAIEALRSLRTYLKISLPEAANNIISIMGVSEGIGKSFVSLNLACLFADIGKRVLLIDTDIRNGRLNDYFQLPRAPGLSEILMGKITLESAIHKGPYDNFSFIACGSYPVNPAELLMTPALKQLITTLSSQFDLVIIDTSPILAVTDSLLVSPYAATNMLVIGAGKHQADEIILAAKRLANAGIKLTGTVFNNLRQQSQSYGYYRYTRYAYRNPEVA